MTDHVKLGHVKEALHLKCIDAKMKQDKVPRSDIAERELLRGKAEAYWDAITIIEEKFGVL